ncbi:hypothetical protein RchiOBHm_Chr2g0117581 [Rosa chinensis]|uniref:Uncharacterized protein n=1 Tax=Rosa chinensis TaxID=74649 RepID=A0A2P6RRJ9_ROSCH|nr:hypothetical protein RchiOBHm_Chr2g0117581 [Rosa chinensis]
MFLAPFLVALAKIRQSSANMRLEILKPRGEDRRPTCDLWLIARAFRCLIRGSITKIKI